MSLRLYVEGGGDSKALRSECRRGFASLLGKAGLEGRMPRIVACGGRGDAFESFCTAVREPRGFPMLLVDAEELVATVPWDHLRARDGWSRPDGSGDDQCHLMVVCMEAWFLADRGALRAHFGPEWNEGALPRNPHVEAIPKADVLEGLNRAAKDTPKGGYSKACDGFALLACVDPSRLGVRDIAPWAARFLAAIRAKA